MNREDIHIISRYSNWSQEGVEAMLKANIYNAAPAWKKFLRLFFISLGVCFTTSGVVFFFAYNWDDLHKFFKIGMMEGLIVLTTAIVLFANIKPIIQKIILTGSAIMVGVLFAVFGQIYQTGANAYDFFLGWTIFITLWVIVANFSILWLIFLILINTTLVLYADQVAHDWSEVLICTILYSINIVALIIPLWLKSNREKIEVPAWFSNTMALAVVSVATAGILIGIFSKDETAFSILMLMTAMSYSAGIWYGLKVKSGLYLSVVALSLIIIVSAYLIKQSSSAEMFLMVSLFVTISVTLVIKKLIDIQKQWNER